MIANPGKIANVIRGRSSMNEYYFEYGQYKWSISEAGDDYFLNYYPSEVNLQQIAAFSQDDWEYFNEMVTYSTREIRTREAVASLSELYRVVKERLFNLDSVLDDIIRTADDFDF